jgi:plasmid replication initiation protein
MSDELFQCETNTPETLGVTPRFVLQRNALRRGAHDMSATAQKVIATAMALLPFDLSSLTVSFPFAAFCKAVGFGDGGEQYSLFKTAVDECMGNYIAIEITNTDTGKREWQRFNWFTWAKVDEKSRTATMIFPPNSQRLFWNSKKPTQE